MPLRDPERALLSARVRHTRYHAQVAIPGLQQQGLSCHPGCDQVLSMLSAGVLVRGALNLRP
jgi:hypothetical protein